MRKTAKASEVIRFLEKRGFIFLRQTGSHAQYKHPDGRRTSVPMHRGELKNATFSAILKQCGYTRDDFQI